MKVKELINYEEKSKIKAGEAVENGKYPFFTSSEAEDKRYNDYTCDTEGIIMGTGGNATLHYCNGRFAVSTDCLVLKTNDKVSCKYLFYFFKANMNILQAGFKGAGLKHTNKNYIENIEMNRLPDINQQKHIVYLIDKVETLVKKHNNIINYLDTLIKARFVEMFGDIKKLDDRNSVKLGSICATVSGGTPSTKENDYYGGDIPWISTVALGEIFVGKEKAKNFITEKALKESATHLIPPNSIMVGTRVGVGKCSINNCNMCTNQDINSLIDIDESKFNKIFLKFVIDEYGDYFDTIKKGATILGITTEDLKSINIPIVALELQDEYVSFVSYIDKLKVA